MSDSSRSMDVLKKILQKKSKDISPAMEKMEDQLSTQFWDQEISPTQVLKKRPGRPAVKAEKKAKNFTLCMGPKYIKFLDEFKAPQKKLMGRGRKVRYIIDQFVILHKRQKAQLEVLSEVLSNVEHDLKKHSHRTKKGEKLQLTSSEKAEISRSVNQVLTLVKVLNLSPKELYQLLSREKWAVMAFCLDWRKNL